jgi:hypothetical protein
MHPNEVQLSLFAGNDLNTFERWKIGRHLRHCDACQAQVEAFRAASQAVREELSTIPEIGNWDRLAAEMTGNIRVGLAAGECVAIAPSNTERIGWRPAAVLASASLFVFVAWWLNTPSPRRTANNYPLEAVKPGIILEPTSGGIALKQNGATLTLHTRSKGRSAIFGSAPGSLRVRYVDDETGQVTINNVYGQ